MKSKIFLIGIFAVIFGAFIFFDGAQYINFTTLKENRNVLIDFVSQNYFTTVFMYILLYLISTAFAIPVGTVLTITGGFLFGVYFGTLYTVIGATMGASVLYAMSDKLFNGLFRGKAQQYVEKMRQGFNDNALSYMLILRLIPIFPFVIVNVVAGFLKVRFLYFFIGTFIGIIPGTFVYSLSGSGLGSIFDSGQEFSINNILTPELIGALIAMGALSTLPIIYKKLKK